jgi:hypothetical protein
VDAVVVVVVVVGVGDEVEEEDVSEENEGEIRRICRAASSLRDGTTLSGARS